jgi:4-amino-4-deoxy-L-arabinose transferase-like glycosyltransferase
VVIFEILGLLHLLDSIPLFFLLQVIFCSIAGFFFIRKTGFQISDLFSGLSEQVKKLHGIDFVLLGIMTLILGGFFAVGISTPPNNTDSLAVHLPRIYYWLQHGSFENWPATNLAQLFYPINGNIQGMWLFLLSGKETLFFLVSWSSLGVILVSTYAIARTLKFNITSSLVSALVILSFPVALLQTYSFQGDLTVAALVMFSIYLFFSYLATKRKFELIAAMIAFALALGTKQSAFFTLPIFGGVVIYLLFTKQIPKTDWAYLGLFPLFFLIFASCRYFQNLQTNGTIFGVKNVLGSQSLVLSDIFLKVQYNLPRYFYQFISFDGVFKPVAEQLIAVKASVFEKISALLGTNLQTSIFLSGGATFEYLGVPGLTEDTSWFGPLCFIMLPLGLIASLFRKEKRVNQYLIFALLTGIGYLIFILVQRSGWTPNQGRYFLLGILPLIPLFASVIPRRRKVEAITTSIISFFVIVLAGTTLLFNDSKPVVTYTTVVNWRYQVNAKIPKDSALHTLENRILNRLIIYFADFSPYRKLFIGADYYQQLYFSNASQIKNIEFFNSYISQNVPVSIHISSSIDEYAFFGKDKTRNLYPVNNISEVQPGSFLLIRNNSVSNELSQLTKLGSNNDYSIYFKK